MGSSLSPVLSNLFMEHFEEVLMADIPVAMRPVLWVRYVDDVFCVYKDMYTFEEFLEILNDIRPSITFTFELSRIDSTTDGLPDLPANVTEHIPFLELNVYRLRDGSFAFSIYRKPVHAGNYLHAYSYQPLSQKSTVIRNMYLRAYRYCDPQFLQEELLRIKTDFLQLGYTEIFIEKCKISAHKGRNKEIRMANSSSVTPAVKQEPLATLTLPFHPTMMRLKPRLQEMGIRLAFSSNGTLRQQLQRRAPSCATPRGSVYVVNCETCPDVYIGQTGKQVDQRMEEHTRDPVDGSLGAIRKHNSLQGHLMDLNNPTQVFRSDCINTRVTVEAALIHSAPTVQGNTASASNDSNDLVAPIICRATKFNWEKLANCIPLLKEDAIPYRIRNLFGNDIVRAPEDTRTQPPLPPVAHRTRARMAEVISTNP